MTPEQIAALPPQDRPIARLIAKRGLSAKFNGHAWRVTGTGVDLTVARLHYIAASDLSPLAIGARRWL